MMTEVILIHSQDLELNNNRIIRDLPYKEHPFKSFAELCPKFGIYVNEVGIDGSNLFIGKCLSVVWCSIVMAAGEYNEDVDINIQARRGNVNIKADRNGNVTVSGANIIVNADKNLDFCCQIKFDSNDIRDNIYSVVMQSHSWNNLLVEFNRNTRIYLRN